jgi:hypothetical protein
MKNDLTHAELAEQFRLLAETANDTGPHVGPQPILVSASENEFDADFQRAFEQSFDEDFDDTFGNEFEGRFDGFGPQVDREEPVEEAAADLTDLNDNEEQPIVVDAPYAPMAPAFAQLEADALETEAMNKAAAPAGAGFWGFTWAGAWVAVAVGTPAAMLGPDALRELHPAIFVAIAAIAIAPALLILYTANAARESRRVRDETRRLAALAEQALAPTDEAETRARTLGRTVRAEIGALQTVVETALDRFAELEAAAARNAIVFDEAVTSARDGAGTLTATLKNERLAFEDLTNELRAQTDSMGENVSRQIRLMRETSRLVRQEYVAADQTFQSHFTSFTSSAALMAERTQAINVAAEATKAAGQRLDATVVTALEALSQATSLTDTARQSADAATQAAHATAGAVRDTTRRAVSDARRVAQMIRNETAAMEESATATLCKLKEAADEARRASEEAQAAADKHAEGIQRRLSAIAHAATVSQTPVTHAPTMQQPAAVDVIANDDMVEEKLRVGDRYMRTAFAPSAPASTGYAMPSEAANRYAGGWSVGPAIGNETPVMPPVSPRAPQAPRPSASENALALLNEAGINAGTVFATPDLDFIANRARQGGASRRQAVNAAAPEAVSRLQALFARSQAARAYAMAFRAKPELATANGGKNLLVAYLLVDAALG